MGPEPLTAVQQIDRTFYLVFGVALAMLLLITALMVCFVIRYRQSRHPEPVEILHLQRQGVVMRRKPIPYNLHQRVAGARGVLRGGPSDLLVQIGDETIVPRRAGNNDVAKDRELRAGL